MHLPQVAVESRLECIRSTAELAELRLCCGLELLQQGFGLAAVRVGNVFAQLLDKVERGSAAGRRARARDNIGLCCAFDMLAMKRLGCG